MVGRGVVRLMMDADHHTVNKSAHNAREPHHPARGNGHRREPQYLYLDNIPGLLWCCFNVTFLWFLRHFASGCDPGPPQVWSLHWADVTVSALYLANPRPATAATDQWQARIRGALICLMSVNCLTDMRQAWQRSAAARVKHKKMLQIKQARPQTNGKVLAFICFTFHINCPIYLIRIAPVGPGRRLRMSDNSKWLGQWSEAILTLWPAVSVSDDDFKINASPSVPVSPTSALLGTFRDPGQRKQLREESSMKNSLGCFLNARKWAEYVKETELNSIRFYICFWRTLWMINVVSCEAVSEVWVPLTLLDQSWK